eukprot:4288904-Amphidinium_carterae.1
MILLEEFMVSDVVDVPGLGREDRLCTAIPNGPEAAVAFFSFALRWPCQWIHYLRSKKPSHGGLNCLQTAVLQLSYGFAIWLALAMHGLKIITHVFYNIHETNVAINKLTKRDMPVLLSEEKRPCALGL